MSIPKDMMKKLIDKTDHYQSEKDYLQKGIKLSEKSGTTSRKGEARGARKVLDNIQQRAISEDVNKKTSKNIDDFISGKIKAAIWRGDIKRADARKDPQLQKWLG